MIVRKGLIIILLVGGTAGCAILHPTPASYLDPAAVSLQVQTVGERGSGWRAIDPGETLHSGDSFALRIEVGRPAHLYVVQVSAGRSSSPLWPVGQDTEVRPGTPTHIPSGAGEWLRLDSDTGEELLYVVASTGPLAPDQVKQEISRSAPGETSKDRDPASPPPPPPPPPPEPDTSRDSSRGYDKARHVLWAKRDGRGVAVMRFAFRHE